MTKDIMIDYSIFKTYDVRGIYPNPLSEEAAEAIGLAAVKYFKNPPAVVVGRDMRASSEPLFRALSQGITSAGSDVIDIGEVTNPGLSQTVAIGKYPVGIMISASHNPPEYNGFKIVGAKGVQLSAETGLEEIAKIAMSHHGMSQPRHPELGSGSDEIPKPLHRSRSEFGMTGSSVRNDNNIIPGKIIKKDIKRQYYDFVLDLAKNIKSGLKVVIDAGNGMGGSFNKPIFDKLPIKYYPLYFKLDGNFPNHLANPAEDKNLRDIIAEVLKHKADLGVAFDGDADRIFFIDDKGRVVNPGYCLVLFVKAALRKSRDKRIYYDMRFPQVVARELKKLGAKPIKTRVGNPFYKERLINQGGAMAAEVSGHLFFKDGNGLDDGLIATVKMLEFLSHQKKPLSAFVDEFTRSSCYSGEINLPVKNSKKVLVGLEKLFYGKGKIDKLDGLTVHFSNWWFNARGSNTEPVMRLTIETKPDNLFFEQKKKKILSEIEKLDRQEK